MILNSRTKFQDYNILGDKTNLFKNTLTLTEFVNYLTIILYRSDIEIGLVKSLVILLPNLLLLVIPL